MFRGVGENHFFAPSRYPSSNQTQHFFLTRFNIFSNLLSRITFTLGLRYILRFGLDLDVKIAVLGLQTDNGLVKKAKYFF